jgi:flagellar M-ring protein FliF
LGATPFTQQINYLRALQAELSRTIMQVEPVAQARVHIVKPESSPFVRDQKPTTASVIVRLRPGSTLNRAQAAGIVSLVSRSVEGLSPDQVTILDTTGRVLSESTGSDVGLANSQLEYRRSLEAYLTAKAEDMLTQLLGPGKAIVQVTADVNTQRVKERRETVKPDGKVITSEKTTTSKTSSPAAGSRGVAGATSNLPPGAANQRPSGGGNSTSSDETNETQYAISRTIQDFEDKVGAIERLTIAALVDLNGPATDAGQPGRPVISVTDATEIIKQAVGFKKTRDEIKVSEFQAPAPLSVTEFEQQYAQLQQWKNIVEIVRYGTLGLAAILVMLLVWLVSRRVFPGAPMPPSVNDETELQAARVASADPEVLARALEAYLGRGEQGRI